MKVTVSLAVFLSVAAVANASPTSFSCSRSMAVGATKPMDSANTIEEHSDKAITSVGGQACGGTLATETPYSVSVTVPTGSYRWLLEADGVSAVFESPFSNSCEHRSTGQGPSSSSSVVFTSEGTVTFRLLASLGSSQDSTTGAAPECTYTVVASVNECEEDLHNCDSNAVCSDTASGFTCACADGWTSSDNGVTCTNVNECSTGADNCDTNADCIDNEGSFVCQCRSGWMGEDGLNCIDVDECAEETDNCDANAMCTNIGGGFECACNAGWTGTGVICEDIDECAGATDSCDDALAECSNNEGSFTCSCIDGYTTEDAGKTCSNKD
eukprot:3680655-Rhodomonas_salina.1